MKCTKFVFVDDMRTMRNTEIIIIFFIYLLIIFLFFFLGGGGGGRGSFVNCQSSPTSCKPKNKVQEYTSNCGSDFVKLAYMPENKCHQKVLIRNLCDPMRHESWQKKVQT